MTTYTLENNVIRVDGEYVCELIGSDPQRLAAMMAALAQQSAQAVPEGWKLVPVRATREQVNAVFMHPDLARTLYRNMVEAAPAAPVAQESCGGCGATDESQRCIGCMHQFVQPAAQQPDTVAVPRELLKDTLHEADLLLDRVNSLLQHAGSTGDDSQHGEAVSRMRALLAGGEA